jgi:hypothetical protein
LHWCIVELTRHPPALCRALDFHFNALPNGGGSRFLLPSPKRGKGRGGGLASYVAFCPPLVPCMFVCSHVLYIPVCVSFKHTFRLILVSRDLLAAVRCHSISVLFWFPLFSHLFTHPPPGYPPEDPPIPPGLYIHFKSHLWSPRFVPPSKE